MIGSAGVRAAVTSWFDAPAVDGLQRVYAGMPWWASGSEWRLDVNSGWGCIGYVHLSEETEQRIGFGGAIPSSPVNGGMKMVTYRVGLVLLFQYLIPQQIPANFDESSYVYALDTLIDDVKHRLRSDHTLGTGKDGVTWQAGEGDGFNQPDIRIQRDLPRRTSKKVMSWQVVEFSVNEVVFN